MIKQAKPIFLEGMSKTKNTLAGFYKNLFLKTMPSSLEIRISGRSYFRLYVNGEFVLFGPARAPHGHLRVDKADILPFVKEGENHIAIEVMGYAITDNGFLTYEQSLVVAEIEGDGKILAATDKSWRACHLTQKQLNVEAMAFGRRVPVEIYRLNDFYTSWRFGEMEESTPCQEIDEEITYLPRGVLFADQTLIENPVLLGVFSRKEAPSDAPPRLWWEKDNYEAEAEKYGTIERPSIECVSEEDAAFDGVISRNTEPNGYISYTLSDYSAPASLDFDFKKPLAGFVGISFYTDGPCTVDIIYNDITDEFGSIPARSDSINRVIRLYSKGGRQDFMSFDFSFAKFVKIIVRGGKSFTLHRIYLRRCQYPETPGGSFLCSDADLNRIYEGAKLTTITNTLDFFMDCPGRERSGWSGDSYFTGRAARVLLGDSLAEKSMLENFLLSSPAACFEGAFPTCCCSGNEVQSSTIFNWNLFIFHELADYFRHTGDKELVERYRERTKIWTDAVLAYRNEAGLFENLPATIFIDWSASNNRDNTSPISYATNAFIAMVFGELYELYGEETYKEVSESLLLTLRELYKKVTASKYALFSPYPFVSDSFEIQDGNIRGKSYRSEGALYYLFWTGLLTKETAPDLAKSLTDAFGPAPSVFKGTAHLSIAPSGIFFGWILRMEMLSKIGEYDVLKKDLTRLCMHMINHGPGTFWETLAGEDSLNHGYGGHFGVVLVRDFLGLSIPNEVEKSVIISPHPVDLKWAKGSVSVGDGLVSVAFQNQKNAFRLYVSAPRDYKVCITLPKELMYRKKLIVNGKETECTRTFTVYGSASIILSE